MTTSVAVDIRGRSREVGAGLGDRPWLTALRERAAELAEQLAWPDSYQSRPWKYYDATTTDLGRYPVDRDEAIATTVPDGVTVTTLGFAEGRTEELLAAQLGRAVEPGTDRFTALHYAFLRDAVLVDVPANLEAAQPVRITRTFEGAQLAAPHTVIVTGANSRVTVIEEYSSDGADILAVPVAEIVPGPGSEVRYYVVHSWGPGTRAFAYQQVRAKERDAALQNLQLVLSGKVVKGQMVSALEARGTGSELLGLAYGRGEEYVDFYTLQDHIGPDTRSDLLYKAALRDSARSVYYGLTRVGLGATNADANQENRNLILSTTARADSDPVLEILTSNVIRASHGATAGPVDEEQLFYLQARGIPRPKAEAMLVWAFLEEVVARVPDEAVREELLAKLAEKVERTA
ncbi:SufD family Fe-S cluster assembly protein [Tepidiforma sp.]|uniref:SufB/SufD family protein n=1 Tax=Tepidiforma sp. TaxID=2682230 RepID=UPI002ADE51AD|nr:SufD family Fe-S cluster assembly protein [Tepidiforma sp.]